MNVRWNYDVLLVIFNDLSDVSDLAHAALVCHDWLPPARGFLYATITLDLGVPSVLSLVRTLRSFHHLRTLMRSLTVIVPFHAKVKEDSLDWIPLLPSNTLRQFTLNQPTTATNYYCSAMASPAVSTVSRLLLNGRFLTIEHLRDCMELPSLKSFSFTFPSTNNQLTFNTEKQPTLTRLSISAYCYCHNVHYVLSNINETHLERLDLGVVSTLNVSNLNVDNTNDLIQGITRHCRSLRHLSIRSSYFPPRPFLDNCIQQFTNLRHLHCSNGMYTDNLFESLPQSLRTLTLGVTSRHPHPISHAKRIAAVRTQGHLSRLSTVTIVSTNWPTTLEDDKIWGIYRNAGLDFYVSNDASVNLLE